MTEQRPTQPQPPPDLTGLTDRIRRADATDVVGSLVPDAASSATQTGRGWLSRWSLRHLVAVTIGAPLLYLVYRSAAGPTTVGDPAWAWLLGATALLGAAALATYLPSRSGRSAASPCAALAGAHVIVAAFMLALGPAVPMRGVLAFGMVVFALVQRTIGASACSLPPR